ncbi:MAG: spermidine/putrescine ABC transporter substrate-binding protein [Rhodospirillales bacterium]
MNKKLTLSAALAAGLLVSGTALGAETLVVANWDGYMPPDLLENFAKEQGIEIEFAPHATNEEIMGKFLANQGEGYDVIFLSSPFAQALDKLGLLAELDHASIPNLANYYAAARALPYDPGNRYSAPYTWGTTGICYRADLVEAAPDSWNDLLDPSPAHAGKITMLQTDRWLMQPALFVLGYSVNETDPAKLAEARDLLIKAKEGLLAYDDTTFYSKLVSGEAVLVQGWDGWCNYGIAESDQIKFVLPKEGADLWVDTMVVPKASEHKELAHAFIDYVLRPDVHAWVAENILYKVPNEAAMKQVDPALLGTFPNLAMGPDELMQLELVEDLGEGQRAFTRSVQEVLSAN